MKKEQVNLSPLDSVIQSLKDDSFFRYGSAVTYDYETYHACQNGSNCCDNDYCRCGVIQDARVTEVNLDLIIKELVGECKNEVIKYCIDRTIRTSGLVNTGSFEVSVTGGYYGQDIDGVHLNFDVKNSLIKIFNELDSTDDVGKIKILLQNEYGYLLPQLNALNALTIKTVSLSDVKLLNDKQYRKVSKEAIDYYTDYTLPRAVCTKSGKFYTVVDGYHRMISALNKKVKNVSIIELTRKY